MKVITVEHTPDSTLSAQLGADSAILRPGEPVFVADPPEAWRFRVIPALRISRLGMHIAAGNVIRHCDSMTALLVTSPAVPFAGIPDGLIDRSFSPGKNMELTPGTYEADHELAVKTSRIGGSTLCEKSLRFSFAALEADKAIAQLSQWCTLRTGDLIVFADAAVDLGTPVLNTAATVCLDGAEILNVRIK